MVRVIKVVPPPHDCQEEIDAAKGLNWRFWGIGSMVECSCGTRLMLVSDPAQANARTWQSTRKQPEGPGTVQPAVELPPVDF